MHRALLDIKKHPHTYPPKSDRFRTHTPPKVTGGDPRSLAIVGPRILPIARLSSRRRAVAPESAGGSGRRRGRLTGWLKLAAKVAASAYLLAGACWVVVGVGYVVGQVDDWPAFLLGSAALLSVACPVLVMSCLCHRMCGTTHRSRMIRSSMFS